MLKDLQEYYDAKGISALKFACHHYSECSSGCEKFTKSKEAFVSTGYENHTLPRLLFISLDSGSGIEKAKYRTLAFVREEEEVLCDIENLPKGKHWYCTHEFARMILRNFKPELRLDQVKQYFAHTNSAKCCMNKEGHSKANTRLFRNCREFIPGEVKILAPDILITQGDEAHESIDGSFVELNPADYMTIASIPPEVRVLDVDNAPVLWIRTFHPRNYGKYNLQKHDMFGTFTKAAREFINTSKRWKR